MVGETVWEYAQRFRDIMGRLNFIIHETTHREWFISGLLLLTGILLMQQKIETPREALEQVMRIESMTVYSVNTKVASCYSLNFHPIG